MVSELSMNHLRVANFDDLHNSSYNVTSFKDKFGEHLKKVAENILIINILLLIL